MCKMAPLNNDNENLMPCHPQSTESPQVIISRPSPMRSRSRPVFCWWVATIIVGGISGAFVSLVLLTVHGGEGREINVGSLRSNQQIVADVRDGNDNIFQEAKYRQNGLDMSEKLSTRASDDTEPALNDKGSETNSKPTKPTFAPTTLSPYERMHENSDLPWWAKKGKSLRNFVPPKGNEMCYVHVGKTAGSSIGCALGFRLHCNYEEGKRPYLPGRLPKSVTHLFHQAVYDCPIDTSYYLFIVRDPLARSRSAFVYGRPDKDGVYAHEHHIDNLNQLYIECPFKTSDDLARFGLNKEGFASDECKRRAVDLMRGTVRYENHHFFNYQYYYDSLPKNANILVIRTEHMAEDWDNLEQGLGGKPMPDVTFPRDNTNQKEERDLILGEEEQEMLCRELCQEIQVYKTILQEAKNINEEQYEVSMEELRRVCPKEADIDAKHCTFKKPDLSMKIEWYRGSLDRLE